MIELTDVKHDAFTLCGIINTYGKSEKDINEIRGTVCIFETDYDGYIIKYDFSIFKCPDDSKDYNSSGLATAKHFFNLARLMSFISTPKDMYIGNMKFNGMFDIHDSTVALNFLFSVASLLQDNKRQYMEMIEYENERRTSYKKEKELFHFRRQHLRNHKTAGRIKVRSCKVNAGKP